MPYRKTPIVKDEVYHVFNRSVAQQPIFLSSKDYQRAVEVFNFYLYQNPPLRFSFYNRLPVDKMNEILQYLIKLPPQVDILAFCLMPNHVHFLLKNLTDNGIVKFMSNFQNSYAKYFNTRTKRSGTLFQPMFKAVRIESDEQLLHVSRYIHLNPVTAYIIKPESLKEYLWTSYPDFLDQKLTSNQKDLIMTHFKSLKSFERFTLDQVDYQRQLHKIKHLILE